MISKVEEEISSFVVNLIKAEAGLKKVDFNLKKFPLNTLPTA